ncbi:hypothetical protein SAMN05421853_10276 [Roseivivax halotolerans]|uniref:Uncharacterized protein n=1 Tax=Roseivivax halotolerans TaxID=93684 RepID=A0A1I5W1N3_9RHOB|nr:hypothetical protein [Roseivivax halotolerans]SFQ13674.1 hypothetical protein SAMN05421853_10276 [Roseivivax halotolerans]
MRDPLADFDALVRSLRDASEHRAKAKASAGNEPHKAFEDTLAEASLVEAVDAFERLSHESEILDDIRAMLVVIYGGDA